MKAVSKWTKIFILVLLTACNAAEDNKFSLTGSIQNAGESTLIEIYKGETLVDTIPLDDQGEFYYEGNAPHAVLYTLVVGQRPFLLVVNNGEKVEFKADLKNPGNYRVEGSATSAKMKELDSITENFRQQHNNLQKEFERRMSNGEDASAIQHELTTKNQGYIRELSASVLPFSMENKDNLAGFYGMLTLYSIDPTGHEEEMIRYMEDIKDNFQENEEVQHFAARMEEIKPLSIGQQAPDFSSSTPEGEEVRLSDFRGKYVLLDFWAAWCAPCRRENPNIVEQYHKFKDQGFTVLGVSLDRDREAWLQAIKDDKLEWTQLSELKMWDSDVGRLYNITAIPASFMIDPEGVIVGKNLRGPALKEFLENHL